MSPANPPTKHHYIPAFYLRRWRGVDNKVFEFTKPHLDIVPKPISPERTGYEERLYELKGYEPEHAQEIEQRFFAPVDELASKSLTLIEKTGHHGPWDSNSRSAWTRFILSLLLRCPEDIEMFREWWHEDWTKTDDELEASYRAIKAKGDPDTYSEYLASLPVAEVERHQFDIFISLVDHAGVGGKINEMQWRILELPEHAPRFLTSDRPVIRTNGLAQKGGHLALPISPSLLFIASHDKDLLEGLRKANRAMLARECNRQIVGSAVRFVWGNETSQMPFIQKRFGSTPQPRLMEGIVKRRQEALA